MTQNTFKSALVVLTILLGSVACEKDPTQDPGQVPPQQQLPNPLPAHALVSRLKWAENDHQTFTYNAKGQVSQLRSQWQYVEGDPTKIRTLVYDFQYDAQDRPVQVDASGDFTVKYFYHGNLVHTTKELYPDGAVAKEVTYIYAGNRVAQEIWRINSVPGDSASIYKHVFSYDAKGNLNKVETFEQDENQQYDLIETVVYSDFDDKINPTSWMLRHPYLPQIRWQFNNPGREVRSVPGGPAEITNHAYEYNAQGLPVSRATTRQGAGVLTMQYQY